MTDDDSDTVSNQENAPSLFSSPGLTAGAFLTSPYAPQPSPEGNLSVPDIQVYTKYILYTLGINIV